ncbi:hypothetical protein PG994_003980 [Apiospora phragmitis]|uniref:Uncharacterized protein n=1 Tax=Apiospora phragmitis TaxID=2905665 RepID=A0ABR1VZS2_9PEZI
MRSRCTNPASAARLFVQLSRTCAQQQQRAPLLDILLPASEDNNMRCLDLNDNNEELRLD